jgi:fumarylacetoacetate (FAA) hydrolase
MRLAHVRERNGPAGAPWRLAADIGEGSEPAWLDLEVVRRRRVAARPMLAHDAILYRQPITTLDDHLGRGLRVATIAELTDGFEPRGGPDEDDAVLDVATLRLGPPILAPRSLRDGYGFEQHVRTVWSRRDSEIPEAWYRLAIFYFSNVSELRGPDDPVWAPAGSSELDYELEVAALIDTPARDLTPDRGEEAIGGYTILNDWSARDLQRDESTVRLGPAKGKDFATTMGPWLVTPDELEDARSGHGFDLAMTAMVNGAETSRGSWSTIVHGFAELAARASSDVTLRPGELLGSGTVGTGCLLEVRDQTLGRYLMPSDEVALSVDRLGTLRTPIVERPV